MRPDSAVEGAVVEIWALPDQADESRSESGTAIRVFNGRYLTSIMARDRSRPSRNCGVEALKITMHHVQT